MTVDIKRLLPIYAHLAQDTAVNYTALELFRVCYVKRLLNHYYTRCTDLETENS